MITNEVVEIGAEGMSEHGWILDMYFLDKGNSILHMGFTGGTSDKEPACQFRKQKRHGFHP